MTRTADGPNCSGGPEDSAHRPEGSGALRELAERLRGEATPISPFVVEEAGEAELGVRAAAEPRAAAAADYALVVESVREGYLLHYGEPRLLAGHDADLALLAGDYLYALGIERLAALGDSESVRVLSDLISECARLHAEGREGEAEAAWDRAVAAIAGLPT